MSLSTLFYSFPVDSFSTEKSICPNICITFSKCYIYVYSNNFHEYFHLLNTKKVVYYDFDNRIRERNSLKISLVNYEFLTFLLTILQIFHRDSFMSSTMIDSEMKHNKRY